MRKAIVLLAGVAVLLVANHGIYQREQLLTDGQVVLLELAPVDPRSLMQGDYMALRFKVADDAFGRAGAKPTRSDGHVVLRLDQDRIGAFARFDQGAALGQGEIRMRYRVRDDKPKFATNAFFFQEGRAGRYADARYGEFRVAADGEAILTGLRDADRKRLE